MEINRISMANPYRQNFNKSDLVNPMQKRCAQACDSVHFTGDISRNDVDKIEMNRKIIEKLADDPETLSKILLLNLPTEREVQISSLIQLASNPALLTDFYMSSEQPEVLSHEKIIEKLNDSELLKEIYTADTDSKPQSYEEITAKLDKSIEIMKKFLKTN